MRRTFEEVERILNEDLKDMPNETDYDEGFRAGVKSALMLMKMAMKEVDE